jgi:cytokinesis protein
MEESRAQRLKAAESSSVDEESNAVLDNLLQMLRNGESIRKGNKKSSRQDRPRPSMPVTVDLETGNASGDAADVARDMLARLQSDGFIMPPSPSPASTSQRRTRRRERPSRQSERDIPPSPLSTEILDVTEESGSEAQATDDP